MSPTATYVEEVEGCRISVFDDLLKASDLAAIHKTLSNAG
jgi:hypothetical protein